MFYIGSALAGMSRTIIGKISLVSAI
jgi:hypothetical protein